jgi:hypothetical protein
MTTDFERIEVIGDSTVTVEEGRGTSVQATGDQRVLDRLIVEVRGSTLRIRPSATGWGGWPGVRPAPPSVTVTVPLLRGVYAQGAGRLTVSRLKGQEVHIGQAGSGTLTVDRVDADKLFLKQNGSGTVTLKGKAHTAGMSIAGSGRFDSQGLEASILNLTMASSGLIDVAATRTALIQASGSGTVIVHGKPACTVRSVGSGTVSCGN